MTITTIITVLSAFVALVALCNEINKQRKDKVASSKKVEERVAMLSDYDRVAKRTFGLERERQKNRGEHFKDETVYLNRAETIRKSSRFFDWVNDR